MPRKTSARASRPAPIADGGSRRAQAPDSHLRGLQRSIGNRATKRVLSGDAAGPDVLVTSAREAARDVQRQRAVAHDAIHAASSLGALRSLQHDGPGHLRRHASWEHKMLGDVDPDTLEIIAAGRDFKEEEEGALAIRSAEAALGMAPSGLGDRPNKTMQTSSGKAISLDTVTHTIDQEIARLKLFQSSPPQGNVADATAALQAADAERRKGQIGEEVQGEARVAAEREIDDAKWDVRLIELTLSDGSSFMVTYGEMNTLADFYGSPAEIRQAPAQNFRGILLGVREESLRKFMRLRNELTFDDSQPYASESSAQHFEGAIGNRGEASPSGGRQGGIRDVFVSTAISGDAYGELKLMGEAKKSKTAAGGGTEARAPIPGREETSYIAGLVRNACHFAPQSWHAWGGAHNKAIALAQESWLQTQDVTRLTQEVSDLKARLTPEVAPEEKAAIEDSIKSKEAQIETAKKTAATKLNAALIENAFGDHFLQDSYAAGHLINKTQIMQWFAQWLDTQGRKRDYSTEEQWRQIQQIAYGQKAVAGTDLYDTAKIGQAQSNDPQTVENMEGDWTARFRALGLAIPASLQRVGSDEFAIFSWWQGQAMNGKYMKADSMDIWKHGPVNVEQRVLKALENLVNDGVIYYNWYSAKDRAKGGKTIGVRKKSFRIKAEYIPKDKAKFSEAVDKAKKGDPAQYQKMAEAVTYSDYHRFLNHGYLQLSSNVLHDHFCANGLDVATAAGETPFKIYGDNAMLEKESGKGVKHSGATSRMSRDSIYDIASTGATAKSTAAIAGRLPTYVRPKGGSNMSLAAWHGDGGELYKFCFSKIFPDAAAFFSKSTVAAKGELAKQASKDAKVSIHSGEAF